MVSPVLMAVAALYAVIGVVIVRRLRKPTCRVCVYRQFCPNRESEDCEKTAKPCWSCGQAGGCTPPTQDSKL